MPRIILRASKYIENPSFLIALRHHAIIFKAYLFQLDAGSVKEFRGLLYLRHAARSAAGGVRAGSEIISLPLS